MTEYTKYPYGELRKLILEMFTRPGNNFTDDEVAKALNCNLRSVKSTRWAFNHPEESKAHRERSGKKQSIRRSAARRAFLRKRERELKQELEVAKAVAPAPVQLDIFKPEPLPLPPPPALIDLNEYIMPKPDMVNSPAHYTDGGIETIDYIRAKLSHQEYIGYLRGNIFKYTSRLGKKGDMAQDAGKLAWYSQELTNYLKGSE
jgi:hypothetical protein